MQLAGKTIPTTTAAGQGTGSASVLAMAYKPGLTQPVTADFVTQDIRCNATAPIAMYLAHDESVFATGQMSSVNGGIRI